MINLLVIDDNAVVRRALEIGVSSFSDIRCVGTFDSVKEAIHFCQNNDTPDVVLLDIIMTDMHGIEFIKYARKVFPLLKIIALTSFETDFPREMVLQAGAHAYLVKNATLDDIAATIRKIAQV